MSPESKIVGQTAMRSKVHPVPSAPPAGEGAAHAEDDHPLSEYLRMDRIPHIWCPTCGIGIAVKCLAEAFYGTKPFNSWQLVLIGDPLYVPFPGGVESGEAVVEEGEEGVSGEGGDDGGQ